MTTTFILIYIIGIPGLSLILGFLFGKYYGYNQRTDELLREQLQRAKENVKELDSSWEDLKTSLFIIQGIKKNRPGPLTLEEQLQKAIIDEDFELAAKIRDQLNQNKDDE